MAIYERGETFSHWVTIRDGDQQKVDPASVALTITDPCGNVVLNSQAMNNSETGIYYYDYEISSTASYGRYTTQVKSTAAASQIGIIESEFFIMPWKAEKDIRRKMGLADTKDIDDADLSHFAWSSYVEGLRTLYKHYKDVSPAPNPASGALFDGSNTSFKTRHYPLGDSNGDGSVLGNSDSCKKDVDVYWYNSDGARQTGIVSVSNYLSGEITITQSDTSAIPADNEGVYLEYWVEPKAYDEFIFREAVAYLGAHYVQNRLEERKHISVADINSNQKVIFKNPKRYYNEYRRLMKLISRPKIGGA